MRCSANTIRVTCSCIKLNKKSSIGSLKSRALKQSLDRIAAARITIRDIPRATPFAFPLLVQRLRESLTSEKLADRIKRMTVELERQAEATS